MSFPKRNDLKGQKQDKRESSQTTKDLLSDSSSSTNTSSNVKQQRQKEAMQKLANTFKKKNSEKKQPDSWQSLIHNLLNSQRGKLPLLLAVEAGNQSMVRELLSAQTAEQLKVSKFIFSFNLFLMWAICIKISLVKDYLLNYVKAFEFSFGKSPFEKIVN